MSRHNLTDSEWKTIGVFLPAERSGKAGRPWKPHRTVVNGILFVLHTGIAWEDLPSEFGKFKTVYNRFRRCLLYTSPSPRDRTRSRMPSSA